MNKEVTQYASVEELIKSLEEYSGIIFESEDVDTREKLLNKISQIQEGLSNEISDRCSHYRQETERLDQVSCVLPELTSKEEPLEDEFSFYLKTKWREFKRNAVFVVIAIVALVFLILFGKLQQEGIKAQIELYEAYGIWLGR